MTEKLKIEDLEFEAHGNWAGGGKSGALVKIQGARPDYMDGYQLIRCVKEVGSIVFRLKEALLGMVALQDGYKGEDIGRMRGYHVAGNMARQALGLPQKDWEEPTDLTAKNLSSIPSPSSQLMGWQDISTAPKNTKVLAAYRNGNGKWRTITACYHTELPWSDEYGDHEEEYAPEGWYEESDSSEVIYQTSSQPTHWQPLPAPPAITEGQDNG